MNIAVVDDEEVIREQINGFIKKRNPDFNTSDFVSKREGTLLEAFLRNSGQTLSRPLLLTRVWGMDSDVEEGNLDNYIHFLRRRLKSVGSSVAVKTVRGIGYRIE